MPLLRRYPPSSTRDSNARTQEGSRGGGQIPFVVWQGQPLQDGQYPPLVRDHPVGQQPASVRSGGIAADCSLPRACPCTQASGSLLTTSVFTSLSKRSLFQLVFKCPFLFATGHVAQPWPQKTRLETLIQSQVKNRPCSQRPGCRRKGPRTENPCYSVGKAISCGHQGARTRIPGLPSASMTSLDLQASLTSQPQFTHQ